MIGKLIGKNLYIYKKKTIFPICDKLSKSQNVFLSILSEYISSFVSVQVRHNDSRADKLPGTMCVSINPTITRFSDKLYY